MVMVERKARVDRNTLETQVSVAINLDGTGEVSFDTGIPFASICLIKLLDTV